MKIIYLLAFFLSLSLWSSSQKISSLDLWPNKAKVRNEIKASDKNTTKNKPVNTAKASISILWPDSSKATGAAVVICPGGAYAKHAYLNEGIELAKFLREEGIIGIVLKYRLPNGQNEIPLRDAQRAIRLVRSHAEEWKVDTNKIAIAGFSAGGHLASTLGTHFDNGKKNSLDSIERYSCKPNLMILFYPVISMKQGMSNAGSREKLLGKDPSPELEKKFSNELWVKSDTPPTIIFLSDNDNLVPPLNSLQFYKALKDKKIPASMQIYPKGGHGWGMSNNFEYAKEWRGLLLKWLRDYKYVK